jgi:hypothetical protein
MDRETEDAYRKAPLNGGLVYALFNQRLGRFRSSPLLAVAIVVGALVIVGWLIALNHYYQ